MEVAIDLYLVSIRRKRKRGALKLPFRDFDGNGASGLTALGTALQPLVKGNYKEIPEKTLTVTGLRTNATGFDGVLKVGTYGREGNVIDVNSGRPAFSKKKIHAEEVPHYFEVFIPAGKDQGFFVAERHSVGSSSSLLRDIFRSYFQNAYPDFMLDIHPLSPDFVVKQYIKDGTPRSVSFVKHSVPKDLADVVAGKNIESKGSVEVIIKSPEKGFFRKTEVAKAITKVNGIQSVYAFNDFVPDDVKMTVDIGGKIRTLSLQNKRNIRSSFDITNDVSIGSSGYPNQKDVQAQAIEIMKDLGKATGIRR